MEKNINDDHLGDTHNGKYVTTAMYNGIPCIKKPRSSDIECAYKAFLLKLEEEGFHHIPGMVEIIKDTGCEHYVAITEHSEVSFISEVHEYYKSCGVLLFLAYLFSSSDLHRDNIIAHGTKPTIIDYETLLSGDDCRSDEDEFPTMLSDSVWNSYLLPRWMKTGKREIDTSGLTGLKLNKDNICSFSSNPNLLFMKNQPRYAWNHIKEIQKGFQYAYTFFMNRKKKIHLWLSLFNNCYFRYIIRKTDVYNKLSELIEEFPIAERELAAKNLLKRAYLNDDDSARITEVEGILNEEVRSVILGEVPLFEVKGDGLDICCHGVVLCKNYFYKSPVERARKKLNSLSETNMNGQLKLIGQLLEAAKPFRIDSKLIAKDFETVKNHETAQHLTDACSNDVTAICTSLLNELEEKSIDGMPDSWIYLNRAYNGTLNMTGVGTGLYNGVIGILCFYAAMYAKIKDPRYLQCLRVHYKPIRDYLLNADAVLQSRTASLGNGIGGVLQALYHISDLTGLEEFNIDADDIFERLQIPEHFEEGIDDVLNGYSGLALALDKVQNIEKAKTIAKRLLPILTRVEPGLTGAAHGASGYAIAIGKLDTVLEEYTSNDKILSLLKWEDLHYNPNVKNWRDMRYQKQVNYMNGWCSGTPGITLCRSELKKISTDDRIKDICNKSINTTSDWFAYSSVHDHDSLCCGNAARIMAASRLGIKAEYTFNRLITAAKQSCLNLQHLARTNDYIPGLMQGYAGIGYALIMYGDNRSGGMLV